MKLIDKRFLATIRNMYLSQYKDVVFVIDVRSITKIPVSWNCYNNLKYFEKESGEGFSFTGIGAIGAIECVECVETYPFTYENFII